MGLTNWLETQYKKWVIDLLSWIEMKLAWEDLSSGDSVFLEMEACSVAVVIYQKVVEAHVVSIISQAGKWF